MKVTITKNKTAYNKFNLTMKDMTAGKLLCIVHALEASPSPIAAELAFVLREQAKDGNGKFVWEQFWPVIPQM
jgi:hypothetical protein